eukprot:CAMPEP_0167766148 /NCGR_PEP_ID=MMETSP0110_2-20121227/15151_1 /TAXON_ID=629695 /ORGANISM="Gymnochlora sp., Strain CCMP2014" /LENGTH=90 /DNA_ID=CAMNT_0007654079 /DNA_START=559 /DNA_END=828 /DNA_ORIENTATION=+
MTWANKHVHASVTSAFMTLQPVGTVVLSTIFLSYHAQVGEILAGVVVVVGLLITCYAQIREARTTNDEDAKYDQLDNKVEDSENKKTDAN